MGGQKKKNKSSVDEDVGFQTTSNEFDPPIKEEILVVPGGRARSNSYSSNPGSIAALTVGTRVEIIGTENVQQRVPKLEGCIGVIKEAPVHPATWFKVVFPPDHAVITFRPSALRPVKGDEASPKSATVQSAKKHKTDAQQQFTAGAAKADVSSNVVNTEKKLLHNQEADFTEGSNAFANIVLLSSTDPNHWIGQKVVIMGGKMDGEVGSVVSSGNGWVQIETRTGEVAKRAYNLSLHNVQTEFKSKEKQKKASNRTVESEVSEQQDLSHRKSSSSSLLSRQVIAAAATVAVASTSRSLRNRDEQTAISASNNEIDLLAKEESSSRGNWRSAIAAFRPTTTEGTSAARAIPTNSSSLERKARNLRDRRTELVRKDGDISDSATKKTVHDDANCPADSKPPSIKRSRPLQDVHSSPPHSFHLPRGPSNSRQVHHRPVDHSTNEETALESDIPTQASEQEQLIVHHALQSSKHGSRYQQLLHQSRLGSGKVDQAVVEARRNYMTKFVQRQKQKLKNRPHLTDLRHGINASFSNYLSDSSVNFGHCRDSLATELRCARLFDEHTFCEVCFLQKWPGGNFCWNELCSASPVYWKLTGVSLEELEHQHRIQQEAVNWDDYDDADIPEATSSSRSRRGSSSIANPVSPRTSAEKRQRQGLSNSGESDSKSPRRSNDSVFSFGSAKSPKGKMKAPALALRSNLPSIDDMESDLMLLSNMDARRRILSNVSPRTQGLASDILALRAGRPVAIPAESPGKQISVVPKLESSSSYGNSSFVLPDAEVSNVAAYLLQMPTAVVGQSRSNQDVPYPLREYDCDYDDDSCDADENELGAINEGNEEYYLPSSTSNMNVKDNSDEEETAEPCAT